MNQQTPLTNYFKLIAFPGSKLTQTKSRMSSDKTTRRSLSLKKPLTPRKSTKEPSEEVILMEKQEDIITLSSGNESDEGPTPSKRHVGAQPSKCQNEAEPINTVELLPSPEAAPVSTPSPISNTSNHFVYNLSPGIVCQSPRTPSKTSTTPGSSGKFYSPTKKRIVNKKSPAKRNLARQFNENFTPESLFNVDEKDNTRNYQFNDDKSKIIIT